VFLALTPTLSHRAKVSTQVFWALKDYKNASKSPLERGFRGVLRLKTVFCCLFEPTPSPSEEGKFIVIALIVAF
jgi:hypothetical protein